MPRRVIVDENAGPGSAVWEQFQQTRGGEPCEYVFLAETHRGIPDVEILDKLLRPDTILLTADCVLHMQALKRGFRSCTLNEHGQLTRKRLAHVRKVKPVPESVHSTLQADYVRQPTHDLARRLKTDLSERQFKRYRTARRRIRSHFGSASAISQLSVTVGSKTTPGELLCGFSFHLAGTSGVKGLRATEGYCLLKEEVTMCSAKSMTRRRFVGHVAATGAAAAWAGQTAVALATDDDAEKSNKAPVPFRIGAATQVITPEVGAFVQGAGVARRATKIRDNLEANALFLSDDETQILLISCDLAALDSPRVAKMREAIGQATGIPPRSVLITCTHTHGGPSLLKTNYLMEVDEAYLDRLQGWLVQLAQQAVQSARPGRIGWGQGTAQVGFNRRVCWADGTHSMHGDVTRKEFAGLEGPDDPQHLALFAADTDGKLIAVLYHNTTHPTLFYGAGVFSADFPGEARSILRKELGAVPVLYVNGAQGDIMIRDLLHPRKESREQTLQRIGRLVADETLRLYKGVKYHDRPVLDHAYEDLTVQVRLPEPERVAESRKVLARIDSGENIRGQQMIMAFGTVHLQEVYGENPVDTLPVHTVRVGDVALVTQPCELYCQFGLDIKRRSPAPLTAVVGLADGFCGYCPTIYGILGGGYSGATISWTRLEPYAGYRIVETAGRMLNRLWRQ